MIAHLLVLAEVHLPLTTTVPIALIGLIAVVWYWNHLGNPSISARRRAIRRVSMVSMFVLIVLSTLGMSVVDGDARPSPLPYLITWFAAFLALMVLTATALADILNTTAEIRQGRVDRVIEMTADFYRDGREPEARVDGS